MNSDYQKQIKRVLLEFSSNRGKLLFDISNKSNAIRIQLSKIIYIDSPNDLNHWINVMDGCISSFVGKTYKQNNKPPSFITYLALLFGEFFLESDAKAINIRAINGLEYRIKNNKKYSLAKHLERNNLKVGEEIEKFYYKLCLDLSKDEYSENKLRDYINEILENI